MSLRRKVYELQGFSLSLDHVQFVSPLFEAKGQEGWQFNLRMSGGVRLPFKFPTRGDGAVAREMLVKALRDEPA